MNALFDVYSRPGHLLGGKIELVRNEKTSNGFSYSKILILHFAWRFHQASTSFFWRVDDDDMLSFYFNGFSFWLMPQIIWDNRPPMKWLGEQDEGFKRWDWEVFKSSDFRKNIWSVICHNTWPAGHFPKLEKRAPRCQYICFLVFWFILLHWNWWMDMKWQILGYGGSVIVSFRPWGARIIILYCLGS